MKRYVAKDLKLRFLYNKIENKYLVLKALTLNQKISFLERIYFQSLLVDYGVKVKIKNRCLITGRAKSVYRYFGVNRMKLKENSSLGLFSYVKKSSW